MDARSLRRRVCAGPRWRKALANLHNQAQLTAGGRAWTLRRGTLVLRVWSRALPRFPRPQSLVHAQNLRRSRTGTKRFTKLPAGRVFGPPRAQHEATRVAGTGE